MSGVSGKTMKLFVREFAKERKAQDTLLDTAKQDLERGMKPFTDFRKRGFLGRLRWLVTGR